MSPCNLGEIYEMNEGPNWDGEPGAVEGCLCFTALSPIMKVDVAKSMGIPILFTLGCLGGIRKSITIEHHHLLVLVLLKSILGPLGLKVILTLVFPAFAMAVGLAESWEADALLRSRGRQNNRLTIWPTVQTMGLASMKSCSLNAKALELTAHWWVERSDKPSAIPIHHLREEAWGSKNPASPK